MRITKKYVYSFCFALFAMCIVISSCGKKDPNSPGVEYMPDMYRSPSFETYSGNINFDDSMTARMPVKGTVARGFMPEPYSDDTAGYANAKKSLKNPLVYSDDVVKNGEDLYVRYCTHCHGATGAGDGLVGLKLPGPPPPYTAPDKINLTEGELFQIITYGKGLMGPHAPLLTQTERWKLVYYVQKLQGKFQGTKANNDSTATASAAPKANKDNKGKVEEAK